MLYQTCTNFWRERFVLYLVVLCCCIVFDEEQHGGFVHKQIVERAITTYCKLCDYDSFGK